jgi:hypothetical protein
VNDTRKGEKVDPSRETLRMQENSLKRLRDIASLGENRGMEKSEGLEVREPGERFLTFDSRRQGATEFDQFGQLDALEVDSSRRRRCRSDKRDSGGGSTETSDERGLRREEVTAKRCSSD